MSDSSKYPNQRMESPIRILSSAGVDRQCHICGILYTKASLPTHQRSCIKKRFKSRSVMSAGTATEYSSFPCVSCMYRIPQHKMMEHLRFCKGSQTPKELNDSSFSRSFDLDTSLNQSIRSVKTAGSPTRKQPLTVAVAAEVYEPEVFKETVDNLESESSSKIANLPCSICNRKFMEQDRLDKHMRICSNSKKTRKVFDTAKARVVGTDMEKYALNPTKPDKKIIAAMNKKSNWRDRHESFVNAIRSARTTDGPPPPPAVNPDYVSCPHCQRRFNADSGARHIPVCSKDPKKFSNRHIVSARSTPSNSTGSLALKKRTAYKPPLPNKK